MKERRHFDRQIGKLQTTSKFVKFGENLSNVSFSENPQDVGGYWVQDKFQDFLILQSPKLKKVPYIHLELH